jgi:hypothetical protein
MGRVPSGIPPAVSLLTETSYYLRSSRAYLRSSAGRRCVRAKSGYATELARLHPRMVAKEAGEMHLEADHGLLDAVDPAERSQYGRSLRASLAGKPTADGLVEVERAAGDLVAGAADDDGLAVPRASARLRRRLPMRRVDVGLITVFERSVDATRIASSKCGSR